MSVKERLRLFYKDVKEVLGLKAKGRVLKVKTKGGGVVALVEARGMRYKVAFEFIGEDFFIRLRHCDCGKDLCGHMLATAKHISRRKKRGERNVFKGWEGACICD